MLSAAASQGLVWRWDIDTGLSQCDRFLYVNDDYIKACFLKCGPFDVVTFQAGTLLAIGIISSGIQDPCDPASALLMDHVHSDRSVMRIGSILGLGLAYANSKRETVTKNEDGGVIFELKKVLSDAKPSANNEVWQSLKHSYALQVKGLTGLALGFILVGTADHQVASEMLQGLMEKSELELADTNMRFLALGIALIFLGRIVDSFSISMCLSLGTQDKSEVFVESLRALPSPFGNMVSTLVDVCAYAGTGNVLKIQRLLHLCSDHYDTKDDKKKDDKVAKEKESFNCFLVG